MNARLSRSLFALLVLLFGGASVALAVRGDVARQSFKAFYCAGKAVAHREDPYRVEPLRTCEHELAAATMAEGEVEPAPLPGYALALLAAFSAVGPRAAAILFALTATLAVAASAFALDGIAGLDASAVFLAFTPLAFLNVAYGEVVPYSVLGLCGAAYFLSKERYGAAAVFVALSLIQPTLGFTAALAILLFVPRARIPVLVAFAVLAIISFAAIGVHGNVEYFTRVLPLQSESELAAADQFSLSHVLFTSGLGATLSLTIARIIFGLATLFGLALAWLLAQRTGRVAYVVLVPPVLALLFGLYVHDIEILAAIPAALVIAGGARNRLSFLLGVAGIALLCVVWTQRLGMLWTVLDLVAVMAAVYCVRPTPARIGPAAAVAALTVACAFALTHATVPPAQTRVSAVQVHAKADDFSPSAWKDYIDDSPTLIGARYAPAAPTWVGLTLVVLAAL